LENLNREQRAFDLVVLDPPSLSKSKKTIASALQAYRKLNRLGLSLVKPDGFLATASCSHHASEEDFFSMVHRASLDAGRAIKLLEKSSQAPDHPILLAMPETKYLKFALFAVN
jgi:23S rRNA (cytosine1962-C5)-methyltransferase